MMSVISDKPYRCDLIRARMAASEPRITAEKLAELAGVSRATVSALMNGSENVAFQSLLKVAGALGLTMAELFEPKAEEPAETASA